jgi:hypothetical protein
VPAVEPHHQKPDAGAHAADGLADKGVERLEDAGALLAGLIAGVFDGIRRD